MADEIAVVVPTLRARADIAGLITALRRQSLPPAEILVVDSASKDGTAAAARAAGARVLTIARADFDHGGTRNLGLRATAAPIVVFLTQDALPADADCLAALTAPLRDGSAAAAFARQLPHPQATPIETFLRAHSYPGQDELREPDELGSGRIRSVFFSNVAAAVRRDDFEAVGGFPERVIMNEDMVLAARLLRGGRRVAYRAAARVVHSHAYRLGQLFCRYFDIGVFFARHADLLPTTRPTGEGRRLVQGLLLHLLRSGHWDWIPRAGAETLVKYAGFQLGKREALLSPGLKRRLAMQAGFFRRR